MEATDKAAFQGDRQNAKRFVQALPDDAHYTYLLLCPKGVPFYAGKGKGNRILQHELEALRETAIHKSNPYKCNKIRKIISSGDRVIYQVDRVFEDNALDCLRREEDLISTYKRRCDGGVLTNLAPGLGSLSSRDPLSAKRHAATLSGVVEGNPERTAMNLFLKSLGDVSSVPIKPLNEYRGRLVAAYPSPKSLKNPSLRNGLTIMASVLASGLRLEAGVVIPRKLVVVPELDNWPLDQRPPDKIEGIIENGAVSDILKLGLATLIPAPCPEDETFELDESQVEKIVGLIGHARLEEVDLV